MNETTPYVATIRMPRDLQARIQALAKRNRRSLTSEILLAIEQHLERNATRTQEETTK